MTNVNRVLSIPDVLKSLRALVDNEVSISGVVFCKTRFTDKQQKKRNDLIILLPFDYVNGCVEEQGLLPILLKPKSLLFHVLHLIPYVFARKIIERIYPMPLVKIDSRYELCDLLTGKATIRWDKYPYKIRVDIRGQVARSSEPEFAFVLKNIKSVHIKTQSDSMQEEFFIQIR